MRKMILLWLAMVLVLVALSYSALRVDGSSLTFTSPFESPPYRPTPPCCPPPDSAVRPATRPIVSGNRTQLRIEPIAIATDNSPRIDSHRPVAAAERGIRVAMEPLTNWVSISLVHRRR